MTCDAQCLFAKPGVITNRTHAYNSLSFEYSTFCRHRFLGHATSRISRQEPSCAHHPYGLSTSMPTESVPAHISRPQFIEETHRRIFGTPTKDDILYTHHHEGSNDPAVIHTHGYVPIMCFTSDVSTIHLISNQSIHGF